MRVKWKRLSALALAVIVSISCMSYPVHAKETKENKDLPKYDFATVEELKQFNTNNSDSDIKSARIYFGKNDQLWWIVGNPSNDRLILYSSPKTLAYGEFAASYNKPKPYSDDWQCDYISTGASKPDSVFPNHYGASLLRNQLKAFEESYFSTEEQKLMKETKIYTYDSKNHSVYATTDKLYLPQGNFKDEYITVGANSADNLDEGLRIDIEYWDLGAIRSPHLEDGSLSLCADGNIVNGAYGGVHEASVTDELPLDAAFEFDLSSVNFASMVPAALEERRNFYVNAESQPDFVLRYKTDKLGSAVVSRDKKKITLKDVPKGTYLVVQRGTEIAQINFKSVHGNMDFKPKDFDDFWESFENCRVWLETTDKTARMTYATLATNEGECSINIHTSNGISDIKNSNQVIVTGDPINDIEFENQSGYYFPDDYLTNLNDILKDTGLTAEAKDSGFVIKGTPTKDVNITLPPATAKTYTITVDKETLTFDGKNEGYENVPSQDVIITNIGNSKVTLQTPTSLNYEIALSATEIEPNGTATLTITPKENLTAGTYNETITVNTEQNTSASTDVSFKVNGALSVSLDASATDIIEGQSVVLTANAQGGSGNYSYTWYADEVEDGTLQGDEVTVTPTKTTTYKVVITDTIENKSATATITVTPANYDLEVPADYTFDSQHIGYKDVPANSFSIKNTGNVDVSNIHVALTGTNADAFTLDITGMQDILTPNGTTPFTVKPNADLGAGTYTAQVEITGETGVAKTFGVSFTVEDHEYKEEWESNEINHWHECKVCGSKLVEEKHTFKWIIDKEATETEKGLKHAECTVCGYKKASVEIPIVTPSNPDKPNTDKPNTDKAGNDKGSVETGDQTNVGLFTSLLVMSALGIAILTVWKKKKV